MQHILKFGLVVLFLSNTLSAYDLDGCSWLNRTYVESLCGMGDRSSDGSFTFDRNNQSTQALCAGEMICNKKWKVTVRNEQLKEEEKEMDAGVYKVFCPAREERVSGRLNRTCAAAPLEKCFKYSWENRGVDTDKPSLTHRTRPGRSDEEKGEITSPTHK